MTSVLDPEVQLAQKLASNEKPVRTKAMKRLRKYVSVRSQAAAGGFSGDELLRLWKGLFYCLWMQDKPLLQEDLSNQISTLIHNFHHIDGQLLYLETFLQTVRREWTGIDRLRLDKFYQLVRFMFRQTFEVLKRRSWDDRLVTRFVDLLTREVLHNNCETPCELQLHILDVYLSELAAVGSAELTADQNIVFIEPFCRAAAKTKNRILFGAICRSIFSTIIDQAPFAIEDLMKEVKAGEEEEEEDSGQESEEEECGEREKTGGKAVKGVKAHDEDLYQSDGSDAELHDIGPVLQFDYGAVAEKLLQVASRSGTLARNRPRLYRIVKVLRDLSEGVFPADDYPEEVSTDEDDDMFGSRKRMKRSHDDEQAPTKTRKTTAGKKEVLDDEDKKVKAAHVPDQNRPKRRKKKLNKDPDPRPEAQPMEKTAPEGDAADGWVRPEAGADASPPHAEETMATTSQDSSAAPSKRKRRRRKIKRADDSPAEGVNSRKDQAGELPGSGEPWSTPGTQSPAGAAATAKKKKNGKQKEVAGSEEELPPAASQLSTVETKMTKRKKKNGKGQVPEETGGGSQMKNLGERGPSEGDPMETEKKQEEPAVNESEGTATTPTRRKKKKAAGGLLSEVSGGSEGAGLPGSEVPSAETEVMNCGKPAKRKIPVEFEFEADELEATRRKEVGGDQTSGDAAAETQFQDVSEPCTASSLQKTQKKKKAGCGFLSFQSRAAVPRPLFCRTRGGPGRPLSFKKKNQTPQSDTKKVTFGLKNNKTAEFKKTDRSSLLSPDGSSRVPFDPEQKPKCGVLKSPPTGSKTPIGSGNTASKVLKRKPRAADFF